MNNGLRYALMIDRYNNSYYPERRRIGYDRSEDMRYDNLREMPRRYNYDDDPDMARMGGGYENTYSRRNMPRRMMAEQQRGKSKNTYWMGDARSAGGDKLTRKEAETWVRNMQNEDPNSPKGGMWSFEDAKRIAKEHGLNTEGQEMVDFYAALNMMYSDYCKVAKEHHVDTEDFFADMAAAFLFDRDAQSPSEKLAAYYRAIAAE